MATIKGFEVGGQTLQYEDRNIATTFSTSENYAIGDYVIYDGDNNGYLYECQAAVASGNAWNSSNWKRVQTSGEIGNLKSALDNTSNILCDSTYIEYDFSSTQEQLWSIGGNGKWVAWDATDNTRSFVIQFNNNNKGLKIIGGTTGSIFAFLKTFSPVNAQYVDFSDSYSSRIVINAGEIKNYNIPSDAMYLYILKSDSSGNIKTPNLTIYNFVDETLSISGAPADAAKTGLMTAKLFNATSSGIYSVGDYVNYEGTLYRCHTAVTTGGSWTGDTNWMAVHLADETNGFKNGLIDYINSANVTPNLNQTTVGITYITESTQVLKIYGTGTTMRRLLFLNGQNTIKTTTASFSKTLDAGTYLIETNMTGYETRFNIDATYTTFTSANSFVIASPGEKSKIITFTAPVMIGFTIMENRNYGSSTTPSYITFNAKKITAKDLIARTNIDNNNNIINKILKSQEYNFSNETEQPWSINASGVWISWTDLELTRSYVIPCKYANTVSITGHATNGSIIAFLQSFNPVHSASVDFCTEYPSRITIAAGETVKYIIPSDAAYLFLLKTSSGGADYTPDVVFTYSDPYTIYPTNDTTDRTAEVEAKLKQFGICKFEKGRYYIKNVQMPDGSTVEGVGAASEIVLEDYSLPDNIWTFGNQTFNKTYAKSFSEPLPAGKYTFTATAISSDINANVCRINFYYNNSDYSYITINRNEEDTAEIDLYQPIVKIIFCASDSIGTSSGDTATFSNISLYITPRTAAFVTKSQCCIRNMTIIGSLNSVVKTADGLRNGILYSGVGSNTTIFRGNINNCFMYNFTGGCICLCNTGFSVNSGFNIDNCYMWDSYAGIDIPIRSEFNRINNCCVTGCYYGVLNNGGNNTFTGCNFSSNTYGFAIDNSDGTRVNNAHGNLSGSTLQHNTERTVYINRSGAGFTFTGCNMDDGGIEIIDSCRILFTGINFMYNSPMKIKGSYPSESNLMSMIMFNGCNMRITENNTYDIDEDIVVKYINCFTEDGTEVKPTKVVILNSNETIVESKIFANEEIATQYGIDQCQELGSGYTYQIINVTT